jgi:hypothetical protein
LIFSLALSEPACRSVSYGEIGQMNIPDRAWWRFTDLHCCRSNDIVPFFA